MEKYRDTITGRFKRGVPSWNKGKKRTWKSPTEFKKGDKGHLGYKHSEESKKLMSKNRSGIKHSEETKKKMMGRIPWNKGIKGCFTTESIENNRKKHIGKQAWNKGKEYDAIKGDKNPNWKGGITPLYQKIRHLLGYSTLMANIKKRDNFTCTICKQRGGKLHVDHYPVSFAKIIKENNILSLEEAINCEMMWDKNNLRTLCVDCHRKTDTYLKPLNKQGR